MKTPNFLTIDIHPDHDFYVQGKDKKMHYVEMKSDYLLSEFIRYCLAHHRERFWQALRNWSELSKVLSVDEKNIIKDTFYFEEKNK